MSKYGTIRLRAGTTAREPATAETCDRLPFDDKEARVTYKVTDETPTKKASVTLLIQRQKAKHARVGSADLSIPLLVELMAQALLRSNYSLSNEETKQLLLAICSGMVRPKADQREE